MDTLRIWVGSIGIVTALWGCSGAASNSITPGQDGGSDAVSEASSPDSGFPDSNVNITADPKLLRAHVEALLEGVWTGTSKFVYDQRAEPDVDADEALNVESLEPNHFTYDGHSIAGGLEARSFLEMAFDNGSVVAVSLKDTLEPQVWTLTLLRASASEVAYELDIKIPSIPQHSREMVVERLAPDGKTLTRQTKVYFEERFIGTREATYTRTLPLP